MPAEPKRPRKIRRDAKLLNIPEKDRKVVAGWLQSDGVACCLQRIASHYHIECSQSTLYEAIAFWDSQERRDRVRAKALAQIESEAEEKGYTPQQRMAALDRRMAEIFAADDKHKDYQEARYLMIADESARTKAELEKLKLKLKEKQVAQKDREIALAIEKFQWDGAKEALAKLKELKSIAADRTLNDDQKIEQVRLRLWGAPPKDWSESDRSVVPRGQMEGKA